MTLDPKQIHLKEALWGFREMLNNADFSGL